MDLESIFWILNFYIKTLCFFLITYLFLERGEREREGEKHQCVVASHAPHPGDLTWNPGMYLDWESNQWPFSCQASIQSTEPHQPGQNLMFYKAPNIKLCCSTLLRYRVTENLSAKPTRSITAVLFILTMKLKNGQDIFGDRNIN